MTTDITVRTDALVSLEQAADILAVPDYVLRRCLNDGMEHLTTRRTPGGHRRIRVEDVLNNYDEIIRELTAWRKATAKDPASESLPRSARQEGQLAKLKKLVSDTVDADTASMRLGVSRPTLRRWERESKILGVRPFGPKQVRYYRESVDALLTPEVQQ